MIFPWIAEEIDNNVWLYCCWLLDTECTFLQESCDCYPDSWEKGKVSNTRAKGGIGWTPSYELLLPGEWEVRKAWSAMILCFYFVSSISWGCKKRLQQWRMLVKTSWSFLCTNPSVVMCVDHTYPTKNPNPWRHALIWRLGLVIAWWWWQSFGGEIVSCGFGRLWAIEKKWWVIYPLYCRISW